MFKPNFVTEREKNNIPFDLYFASATSTNTKNYLLENNLPILYSQYYQRSDISKVIKKSDSKIFVDSGAHTAHTKNLEIDVDNYIEYINTISDDIYVFAQVDKIPGIYLQPKTKEDWALAPKLSWDNFLYMYERVKEPKKLMMIHHQGENFKWLENMLEWTDKTGNHINYIGLSPRGDVPVSSKINYLSHCFNIIEKSSNPNVKTHALGMTSLNVLEMFPLYSADSTTWKLIAAMGSIITPWGVVYVSTRGKYNKDYLLNLNKEIQDNILNYIELNGFTFDDVSNTDNARYIININYLKNWAKNYKYKGINSSIPHILF